ncbi:MAG: sugar-binding protein [Bacteroidota bacterium]|nr:sugar-binding protein [Bacteroidota bacterium]
MAQSGLTFEQIQEKLKPYFADELIGDLKDQLPRGVQYRIWGWDVGDFSGDGAPDLVMSIRLNNDKGRNVRVYLFADIDGYLTRVGTFPYTFVENPIEVGVLIKDNGCFVIEKAQDFDWTITGYRLDNGSLVVLDSFRTERVRTMTHESYRNFQTLSGYEKYRDTRTNDELFYSDFLCIPSYPRGKYIYKGFAANATSTSVKYISKGAYYWSGADDLSFSVRSAHNDQYLYFLVKITDDVVIPEQKEGVPHDKVEIWLDMSNVSNRFIKKRGKTENFRTRAEGGIFAFSVRPGNFADKKPSVRTSAVDVLTESQKQALQQVKVASTLWDKGYIVKIRIPFQLLGFVSAPVEEGKIVEYGCTVVVRDIDNEFRPEEETFLATSKFDNSNPSSYGALLLMPHSLVYGEVRNIYADAIAERLHDIGF